MKRRKPTLSHEMRAMIDVRLDQLMVTAVAIDLKSSSISDGLDAFTVRDRLIAMRGLVEDARTLVEDIKIYLANSRPPFHAEYLLHLSLTKEERDAVIGDMVEEHNQLVQRFGKRYADVWFYKQVGWSIWPLARRMLMRVAALVWISRFLRSLIS